MPAKAITVEELQTICKKFNGVTEDIKWDHHLCFNVGGKMFLVTSPDEVPVSASFKASDDDFEELISRTGLKPAQYLAKHKWVFVEDINFISIADWERLIEQSYQLIASKLTKKFKKEIGLIE